MEKPILFNTEMVKGILEGRKTTTRRIVKPQPKQPIPLGFVSYSTDSKNEGCFGWGKDKYGGIIDYAKPPYRIGDILYVRETWLKADNGYFYRANATPISEEVRKDFGYKWKPSIHMPKEAARIFLSVKDVRVERLQDITEEEAEKEGAKAYGSNNCSGTSARIAFAEIWDGTTKSEYEWRNNPWVWVIEFENLDNYKI